MWRIVLLEWLTNLSIISSKQPFESSPGEKGKYTIAEWKSLYLACALDNRQNHQNMYVIKNKSQMQIIANNTWVNWIYRRHGTSKHISPTLTLNQIYKKLLWFTHRGCTILQVQQNVNVRLTFWRPKQFIWWPCHGWKISQYYPLTNDPKRYDFDFISQHVDHTL